MKITKAVIGPMPVRITDPLPMVTVTFEDGSVEELFRFYPDELAFSPEEFVGLTKGEAYDLFHEKDRRYLQS